MSGDPSALIERVCKREELHVEGDNMGGLC